MNWYPTNKAELNKMLDGFLGKEARLKHEVHGLIIPHAGYFYSGAIAGKAFSCLKGKGKKAAVLSPSHYFPFSGVAAHNRTTWQTPLGEIKVAESNFEKVDISEEHAIGNQIPFLQKLGFKEILPLVIGEITIGEAKGIAKKLENFDGFFIFSSDLSHFLPYEQATKKDRATIEIIKNSDTEKAHEIDACGIYPLFICLQLCKLKGWKPELVEYKNSGDITGDGKSVVGYASFVF